MNIETARALKAELVQNHLVIVDLHSYAGNVHEFNLAEGVTVTIPATSEAVRELLQHALLRDQVYDSGTYEVLRDMCAARDEVDSDFVSWGPRPAEIGGDNPSGFVTLASLYDLYSDDEEDKTVPDVVSLDTIHPSGNMRNW